MSYWWYVIPVTFFIEKNNYYGWHQKPMSDYELIADGVALLLFILIGIGTISNRGAE